jgi:DNA polymerase-3 subunit gamma/tau
LIDLTDRDREEIDRQARTGGLEKIQQALNLLIVREPDLKMTSHPRLVLEAIMIKLCRLGDVLSFDELLKKIHTLEKKLAAFPNKSGSAGNLSDPGLKWEVEKREGPGSEMSTEEPEEQNWGGLLDHLASKNGAMANVLKEWRFLRLKGHTLEIARGDNPFSSSYLDEPERLDKFIDYCREYFNRDLIIKIVGDKKKDERIDAPEREGAQLKQKEHSDLPQPVQDILQIFQGEIKEEVSIEQEDTKESG